MRRFGTAAGPVTRPFGIFLFLAFQHPRTCPARHRLRCRFAGNRVIRPSLPRGLQFSVNSRGPSPLFGRGRNLFLRRFGHLSWRSCGHDARFPLLRASTKTAEAADPGSPCESLVASRPAISAVPRQPHRVVSVPPHSGPHAFRLCLLAEAHVR